MVSKNVVVNGIRDIEIVDEVIDENNLRPTECLVENCVSLISPGTELSRVYGLKKGATYPMRPGYSAVGKIVRKGSAVTDYAVGDIIAYAVPHMSDTLIDVNDETLHIYKVDPATSFEEAAYFNMCAVAFNGIQTVDVKMGDVCVIIGLGTLGLILAQMYRSMGIDVIVADPMRSRCDLAERCGIEKTVSCSPDQQVGEIMRLTGGRGADIVVEATGLSACVATCVQVAAKFGKILLLGSPREDHITNVTPTYNAIHMKMLTVIGAFNGRFPETPTRCTKVTNNGNIRIAENLMREGKLNVEIMVSHRVRPTKEELLAAYDGLMNNKNEYTGVIIKWR